MEHMMVEINNVQYLVIEELSLESLKEKYPGMTSRMEACGVQKKLRITNPKFSITYDAHGQSSNLYLAYWKNGKAFWDLPAN